MWMVASRYYPRQRCLLSVQSQETQAGWQGSQDVYTDQKKQRSKRDTFSHNMQCNRVSFLSYQFTSIGIISSTAWREQFSSFPGCEFFGRHHPFPCALFSVPPSPHLRPCTSSSPTTLNSNLRVNTQL